MPLPYNKDHKERSRDLRKNQTEAESKLWSQLRRKQILDLQFYRQKPIHQYIVDFYCPKARLVIEVDGGQHWQPDHAEQDRERDAVLEQLGLKVLRFSNFEVLRQLQPVLARSTRSPCGGWICLRPPFFDEARSAFLREDGDLRVSIRCV